MRRPSRTATPTCAGIDASSSAAVAASASIWSRERSSAASTAPGAGRPAAASAMRCFARSSARASMAGEATLRAGWTPPTSTTTFRPSSSRKRRSSRATRRGCSSTGADSGAVEHMTVLGPSRSRRRPARGRERHARRARALAPAQSHRARRSRCCSSRSLGDGSVGGARATVSPASGRRGDSGRYELVEPLGDGRWLVELDGEPAGEAPLPPYIHEPLADAERYQTVYGEVTGSAAAPTAGLHFTPRLVELLDPARVTLHVGLDTFRPLTEAVVEEHELRGERYSVDEAEWGRIAEARSVLAVGTTTVQGARDGRADGRARGTDEAVHHARLRVRAGRRAPDELPPPASRPSSPW